METKTFLENILQFVAENHFSDLHITSQAKARIRNRIWDLEEIDKIGDLELWEFSKQKVSDLIKVVISEENFSYFLSEKEMDLSYKIDLEWIVILIQLVFLLLLGLLLQKFQLWKSFDFEKKSNKCVEKKSD